MIERLESIDRELFLWLNGLHTPWLDQPMYYVSEELTWLPVYLLLLYMVYRSHGLRTMWWSLLAVALVVTLCDRISVELFKNVFQRFRPTHHGDIGPLVHTVNDYRGGRYGFISSHAANYFGIATLVWLVVRPHFGRRAWWILPWAALIAYSRIYLGVHYPADVAVGALLGLLVGWGVYLALRKYICARGTVGN
jgi:undecaprenyl-diphosphatase